MPTASVPGVRARARAEMVTEIKDVARSRLAADGAAGLSLRAVSRDMGMVSSALYRYFASRDELLTALIVDAYDAIGEAAETAAARARRAGADPGERWLAICRAVRRWAKRHPHEFALVYGSPIPGYAAPQSTVGPATRVPLLMAEVVQDAVAAGLLAPLERPLPAPTAVTQDVLDVLPQPLDASMADLPERSLLLWIALVGTITFELFGHLHNVVDDNDRYFDRAMVVAAEAIGLRLQLS